MTPHKSNLRPDGTVFPPVTPDPPAPPGQDEILVPDIDVVAVKRGEDSDATVRAGDVEGSRTTDATDAGA